MDNPQSWIILWDYFTLYNLNFKTAQKEYHPSPLIDHIIKELTSKKSQKRSRSEPPWHPHCIMGTAKNYKTTNMAEIDIVEILRLKQSTTKL